LPAIDIKKQQMNGQTNEQLCFQEAGRSEILNGEAIIKLPRRG